MWDPCRFFYIPVCESLSYYFVMYTRAPPVTGMDANTTAQLDHNLVVSSPTKIPSYFGNRVETVSEVAASHAPASFARLKRCGQNVLVRGDEHDPRTDPWLEAALTISLFLASRTKSLGSEGDLAVAALRDVEERIQTELKRIEKMEDSTQGIRRNCHNLEEELGKARLRDDAALSLRGT